MSTLDITEDLTEAQLAELAFDEEIVVLWRTKGHSRFGIIVGYDDGDEGVFTVAPVIKAVERKGETIWQDSGQSSLKMRRDDFVVFGPANRDPENRPNTPPEIAGKLLPFVYAVIDLMAYDMEMGGPAFNVRLDVKRRPTLQTPATSYRVLARPVEQPMMHDEIEEVLRIASRYELAAFHSNVGIEIRDPMDSSD